MVKLKENKYIGEPLFSVVHLDKSKDFTKQLIKVSVAIRIPNGISWDEHNQLFNDSIDTLKKELDKNIRDITGIKVMLEKRERMLKKSEDGIKNIVNTWIYTK